MAVVVIGTVAVYLSVLLGMEGRCAERKGRQVRGKGGEEVQILTLAMKISESEKRRRTPPQLAK